MTEPQIVSIDSQESLSSKKCFIMSIQHRRKWNQDETQKYLKFVQENKLTLEQTEKKQKQRVYNRMSEYIGTRTTHQCRSHHQKVMKRHSSIDNFIVAYGRKKQALLKAQQNSKLMKAWRIRDKSVSLKINKQPQIKNKPLSQQKVKFKIQQQFQAKQFQKNYQLIKNVAKPSSKPRDSQPIYHQDQSYHLQGIIKPSRKLYEEPCNIFQDRLKQLNYSHYNDVVKGEYNGDNYDDLRMGRIYQSMKRGEDNQFNEFEGKIEYDKFFDVNKIGLNQKSDLQNIKFNRLDLKHIQREYKLPNEPSSHRKYQYLPIEHVHKVCQDSLKRKNLNEIKLLQEKNMIQVTQSQIKIPIGQGQVFQVWIQCPNFGDRVFNHAEKQRQAERKELLNQCQKIELTKKLKLPEQKTLLPIQQPIASKQKYYENQQSQDSSDIRQYMIHRQRGTLSKFLRKLAQRGSSVQYMMNFTPNANNKLNFLQQVNRNPPIMSNYQHGMRHMDSKQKMPEQKTGTGLVDDDVTIIIHNPNYPSKQSYEQYQHYHHHHFPQPSPFRPFLHHHPINPRYVHQDQFNHQMFPPQPIFPFPSQPYGSNFQPIQKPPSSLFDFSGKYQRGNQPGPRYDRY